MARGQGGTWVHLDARCVRRLLIASRRTTQSPRFQNSPPAIYTNLQTPEFLKYSWEYPLQIQRDNSKSSLVSNLGYPTL
jgi:hypothetical protein